MKKKLSLLKWYEGFEVHHKIIAFVGVMVLTFLITRFLVLFYNPNPILFGLELHHFDYGLFLLMVGAVLLLFDRKRHHLYFVFIAVSIALIIDELWYIRGYYQEPASALTFYNSTLAITGIFMVLFILIILFINSLVKKREK